MKVYLCIVDYHYDSTNVECIFTDEEIAKAWEEVQNHHRDGVSYYYEEWDAY